MREVCKKACSSLGREEEGFVGMPSCNRQLTI